MVIFSIIGFISCIALLVNEKKNRDKAKKLNKKREEELKSLLIDLADSEDEFLKNLKLNLDEFILMAEQFTNLGWYYVYYKKRNITRWH